MVNEREIQWQVLCERERANLKALEIEELTSPPSPEFRALLREWWKSIEELLTFYVNEACVDLAPRVLPLEVINAFKQFAGYLASGEIPGMIADVAARGSRRPGPSERRDISLAVAYIMAARGGIEHSGELIVVNDPTPVKTICEAFHVSRSTVQRWQKNFRPGGLGVTPINAEILKSLMEHAGERYRSAGRAHLAIRNRCPTK